MSTEGEGVPATREDYVIADSWSQLRQFTQARIALGRTGDSLPTQAVMDFGLAHARARDAVHAALSKDPLRVSLLEAGFKFLEVRSAATNREEYLRRPDLGRRLHEEERVKLGGLHDEKFDLIIVLADGLSAQAVMRHAVLLLHELTPKLMDWRLAPIIVAEQARVALGDEIGELSGAQQVLMLVGERPGLSAFDSLGAYLTYHPRVGRTDAERNCVSNIRTEGLAYADAADKLYGLMTGARRLRLSGIGLKDESGAESAKASQRAPQIKDPHNSSSRS